MFLMRYIVWKENEKLKGHFLQDENRCANTAKLGVQLDSPLTSEDTGNPPHALDTTKKKQYRFSMYRMDSGISEMKYFRF
jgi:hypothetical protein